MSSNVILIGAIDKGQIPSNGETMKNQLFIESFGEIFDKVIAIDTINWKKRPWCLVKIALTIILYSKYKIIISASGSASKLISILYYLRLRRKVYFWVVGGNLYSSIKSGNYNINALKKLEKIIVQGRRMVDDLEKLGIKNAFYVPNSKPILLVPDISIKQDSIYRFVFLSRIHPDKGISEIFDAVNVLINDYRINNFIIDFYGHIDDSYKTDFISQLKKFKNLSYKGILNLRDRVGYELLSTYDVMLFPTYWNGEGFPGVVIDANIAAIPLIATDWNLNKDVVINGKTGILIPVKDSNSLANQMSQFINKSYDLLQMKKNCINNVQQYAVQKVLSNELMKTLKIID